MVNRIAGVPAAAFASLLSVVLALPLSTSSRSRCVQVLWEIVVPRRTFTCCRSQQGVAFFFLPFRNHHLTSQSARTALFIKRGGGIKSDIVICYVQSKLSIVFFSDMTVPRVGCT